jgi:hypothetical protein
MFLRRLTSTRRTCAVCAGKSVCVPRCVRCACVCVCVCVCTAWHVGSGDSLKPRSRASALMCGGLGCCALAAVALPAVCLPPWLHARLRGAPAHQQMLPALLLLGHVAPTMRRVSFHATKLQPAHGTQSTQHICVQQHTGLADAQTACTREACTRSLPNEQAAGGTAALVASQCCAYVQAAAPWQHASRNASRGQQLSTQRATMVACAQLAHRRSLADTSRNH